MIDALRAHDGTRLPTPSLEAVFAQVRAAEPVAGATVTLEGSDHAALVVGYTEPAGYVLQFSSPRAVVTLWTGASGGEVRADLGGGEPDVYPSEMFNAREVAWRAIGYFFTHSATDPDLAWRE